MTAVATRPETEQAQQDPRDPDVRLEQLLDPESIEPLHPRDSSGMYAVRGRIDGTRVI
ncbi:acyl-CoA carboxylase subunit beta, partial [Saccharopolyspora elongata]